MPAPVDVLEALEVGIHTEEVLDAIEALLESWEASEALLFSGLLPSPSPPEAVRCRDANVEVGRRLAVVLDETVRCSTCNAHGGAPFCPGCGLGPDG